MRFRERHSERRPCAVGVLSNVSIPADNHHPDEAGEKETIGDIAAALPDALSAPDASLPDVLTSARTLWADFRFDHALAVFQKAAAREPENPVPLLLAAKRLFSIGRFEESGQFLRTALAREPGNSSTRRMLAEVLERNGELAEAEDLARAALRDNRADARTARALAHIVRRTGRIDEAVEILRNQLHAYPDGECWRINHELAICLDAWGEFEEAIAALLRAKAELRPVAQRFLDEWRRRAARRAQFAQLLDRATVERWRAAGAALHTRHPVAILAGHPRSGTTLIEQMLARHSAIVTTDETGILRREFVEPIVMGASSTGDAFAEVDSFDAEQLQAGRDFYFRATEAHLGEPIGGKVLIEKDPLATCDLGWMLRLLPECQVIFPLRDPRDVCVSYFFTLVPLNADSAPALDLASTCAAVRLTLKLWTHWRGIIPQNWDEVRYERLVQNPRGELIRLLQSLSLPFEEGMLAPSAARCGRRGVSTPSYANVTEPLSTRAIGRWQNYLPWLEPHLAPLETLLREFGYA